MNREFERLISYGFVADTKANRKNYHEVIEAERAISSSKPNLAVEYASSIIVGRFEEAELTILKEPHWASVYATDVLNKRWDDAESVILSSGDLSVIWGYFRDMVKERWLEAEPVLFRDLGVKKKYYEYLQWLESSPTHVFVDPTFN